MIGPRGTRTGSNRAERGQTAQDFAVGIGLVILAVAFVFAFVPTVLAPFTGADASGDTAQADRIAATVLEDLETGDTPNEINTSRFDSGDYAIVDGVGNRTFEDVNVTVEYYDGDGNLTIADNESGSPTVSLKDGDVPEGSDFVTASRIVTTDRDDFDCAPSCQLIVRVW